MPVVSVIAEKSGECERIAGRVGLQKAVVWAQKRRTPTLAASRRPRCGQD